MAATPVGRVAAADADEAGTASVKYLLDGHTDVFEIDEDSGVIITSARLDREDNSQYQVIVIAPKFPSSNDLCVEIVELVLHRTAVV